MFLSRGDRDLGVALQTHPGRQAFIASGSNEPRSALESRRVSLCPQSAGTLRSASEIRGTLGFLPQPGKALERPSSTRLEARFPYHGSGAMTRSPSPLAWRPDFPGAPREAH